MMELKPPTTFDEQLKILRGRNCWIADEALSKRVLQLVNYYRLSAYFLPFRNADGSYRDGTSFDRVYQIYEFDRKMRGIIFSAIEEVEVFLRTQLSYYHAHKYGQLGYMDGANYNSKHNHAEFLRLLNTEIERHKNAPFVKHHLNTYDGSFPTWVVTELFSFGMLSRFYADLHTPDRKEIARVLFKTTNGNLGSWLHCCTILRNSCAHYGRLYYQVFPLKPATPKGHGILLGRRLFDYLFVLTLLYPDFLAWNHRILPTIEALFDEYRDDIELSHIGFPEDWNDRLRKSDPQSL